MAQRLITSDPKIMMGKPTVTGTRITAEGIRAAIGFAAEALRADVIYPVEKVPG